MNKKELPFYIKAYSIPGTKLYETHISYVLSNRYFTYKIKKPVKFPFVDYSTLAKRKYFCQLELKLNRRFAKDIYLKTTPIRINNKIVDYAVVMKTLPAQTRLDILLKKNAVTRRMIRELAEEIWKFHHKAETTNKISAFGHPNHIKEVFMRDLKNIHSFIGKSISRQQFNHIYAYTADFIGRNNKLFINRIKMKKIKDLHGDLHSENIFYFRRPCLFDCIEFNPNFRYIDSAAEVAFLLMDLESRGKRNLADELLKAYLKQSRDYSLPKLLDFYKCHYACVRGMVNSMQGDHKKAGRYFRQAEKYSKYQPRILAIGGMIGSGKSTLAQSLGTLLGFPVLRSDSIRKQIAKVPTHSNQKSDFGKGIYKLFFTNKTYQRLFKQANNIIKQGQNVILDASFSKPSQRRQLMRLANKLKANFLFIETRLPDSYLLKRLKQRKNDISDAGPDLLNPFKKRYIPPKEIPAAKRLTVEPIGHKKSTLKRVLYMIKDSFKFI